MKLIIFKSALIFLTFICSTLNVMAAPEDHGKWYSVDDDSGSSVSPIGLIIGGIVIVFLGYIMLRGDYEESKKSEGKDSNIGCNLLGIIGGVVCILVGLSRCSG